MNKAAWALVALGVFAGTACKSDDSNQTFEISESASVPVTLSISGMT